MFHVKHRRVPRRRRCPRARSARTSPSCRSTPSPPTRASPGRSSTRTPSPNWSPPSRKVGLLQPVVVRQLSPGRYELIMGERRWRACREAGLEAIPAIVRATEDEKLLLDALLENLHRAQLNPLEEAAAYDQLPPGLQLHPRPAGRPDRPLAAPGVQHAASAEAGSGGPAPGRGRGADRRSRSGAALGRGLGGAGAARPADRRRGALGPFGRRGRHADGVPAGVARPLQGSRVPARASPPP